MARPYPKTPARPRSRKLILGTLSTALRMFVAFFCSGRTLVRPLNRGVKRDRALERPPD